MLFPIIDQVGAALVLETLLNLSACYLVLVLEFGKDRCRHDKVSHASECIYKPKSKVRAIPTFER
jgi:hypothetical protein